MKTSRIKNWIKYFAGTLAVSGMLAIGGCDNNTTDQQKTNYENEVEAAENEIGDPNRDNVNQEIDADTYDTEDASGQPARTEGQEANETNTTENQRQQDQQDTTRRQNGNLERTEDNTQKDQH